MLKKISALIICMVVLLNGISTLQAKTCGEVYIDCLEDNGYYINWAFSILAITVCYPGYLWCITFTFIE